MTTKSDKCKPFREFEDDEFIDLPMFAKVCGRVYLSVFKAMKEGGFPGLPIYKIGGHYRIKAGDVRTWLEAQRVN